MAAGQSIGRMARPLSEMRSDYHAVVVGSGYGGGVAASRLARMGFRVAVLERGREFLPGDFPRSVSESQRAMQINSRLGRIGEATALYDVRAGDGTHVIVGCGLGGTSLINANVCLTPNVHVLTDEHWPSAIRADLGLQSGYGRARDMLSPRPLPRTFTPMKVAALGAAAQAAGKTLERVPLHIAFEQGANAAGVVQPACTNCGDCMGGCNVGAKTTVHNTYLADANQHGAQMFCEVSVRTVEQMPDGRWRILLRLLDHADRPAPARTITADAVILAAGTLGTNEILMRSREQRGLATSDMLGRRISTNADAIAFASNTGRQINGIGIGHPARKDHPKPGPAVASMIDFRGGQPLDDGVIVVEASIQSAMAPLLPLLFMADKLMGTNMDASFTDALAGTGAKFESLFNGAYTGAIQNLQTFLAVGHDANAGEIMFEHDRALVRWPDAARQAVYGRIEAILMAAVAATGGTYVPNPATLGLLGGNTMSVHPLGGAAMAEDPARGVVDHKGRVFDTRPGKGPADVYRGLYVVDGASIPRSLGVHPLLTITAVAERAMALLAKDTQTSLDTTPISKRAPAAAVAAAPATAGA